MEKERLFPSSIPKPIIDILCNHDNINLLLIRIINRVTIQKTSISNIKKIQINDNSLKFLRNITKSIVMIQWIYCSIPLREWINSKLLYNYCLILGIIINLNRRGHAKFKDPTLFFNKICGIWRWRFNKWDQYFSRLAFTKKELKWSLISIIIKQ